MKPRPIHRFAGACPARQCGARQASSSPLLQAGTTTTTTASTSGTHWLAGRPPASMMGARRDYRAGWRDWRRGERLRSHYRNHYQEVDYRTHQL
jgi:Ni/Co efflux regulator RcnB